MKIHNIYENVPPYMKMQRKYVKHTKEYANMRDRYMKIRNKCEEYTKRVKI